MGEKKKKGWTYFDLFAGAGGFTLSFRTAGFKCLGFLEPSTLWGNSLLLNFPENDRPKIIATGKRASLKPKTVLQKLEGERPDVILAQPKWPKITTGKSGKERAPVYLAPPNDWFGDPRNKPMKKILKFVEVLQPKVVLISHISKINTRRDLGLLALHCTALRRLGYTVQPCQINDSWYGAPKQRFRIVVIGVKGISLSKMALFWPPDRIFEAQDPDPSWVKTSYKYGTLIDTWYPLAPQKRKYLPPAPSLVEAFEDLPAAATPWPGGPAPLDQKIHYSRKPWGWYARLMRRWVSHTKDKDLTMHVCIPGVWLGSKKQADLHVGWLADVLWRNACIEAHERGEPPPERDLEVPLPDPFLAELMEEEGVSSWIKMPPPPMANTPPLLWEDRFLRLFSGGSPERTYSLREEARLCSFPDSWKFAGGFVERLEQILNGFPPVPGLVIARTVKAILEDIFPRKTLLPECPFAPLPRSPEERKKKEGTRGQAGELPFP